MNTLDISPTKNIVVGVMFANLASYGAPPCTMWGPQDGAQLVYNYTFTRVYGSHT